jgi:hypothetical protein
MATALNQPVAGSTSPRTFFFNGRLLSAEDLQREQTARESGQSQLARLLGCGIASGLEITGKHGETVLTIGTGVGITPSGGVIAIDTIELDLAAIGQRNRSGGFSDCLAAMSALSQVAGGLYLLVLTPTWLASGRATTTLGEVGACNRKLEQPAVRARLLAMKEPADVPGASGKPGETEEAGKARDTLRNRAAHSLLAPEDPETIILQTTATTGGSGAATRMVGWLPEGRVPALTADDLPLAVVYLSASATIDWCDGDAAQRRLAPPPGLAGDRFWRESHTIEMEAFARQFVAQFSDQQAAAVEDIAGVYAFLPPVALVTRQWLELLVKGFRLAGLNVTHNPTPVSRARFAELLQHGLRDSSLPITRSATGNAYSLAGSDLCLLCFESAPQAPNK